jgi:hypothetical protein
MTICVHALTNERTSRAFPSNLFSKRESFEIIQNVTHVRLSGGIFNSKVKNLVNECLEEASTTCQRECNLRVSSYIPKNDGCHRPNRLEMDQTPNTKHQTPNTKHCQKTPIQRKRQVEEVTRERDGSKVACQSAKRNQTHRAHQRAQ